MPFNLLKKYPELLELGQYSESKRTETLRKIFNRDIQDNEEFNFRLKQIRPFKKDGIENMDTLFTHLTCEVEEDSDYKRIFDIHRSQRLHWIKTHINEEIENIKIFSVKERDNKSRKDVFRTYIFNEAVKYVVVLEPQRSNIDYYLLTAYYLNRSYGEKSIRKKMKKKLDEVL